MTNFLQHATTHLALNDPTTAYNSLLAALRSDPEQAEAWHLLGHLLTEKFKKYDAAAAAFARANALRPNHFPTLVGLGWNLHLCDRDSEALPHLHQALAIDRSPLVLADLAALAVGDNDTALALRLSNEAVVGAPDLPLAHMMQAFALFHASRWLEGFHSYEWRFRYKMPHVLNYPYPLWRGEQVDRLFLQSEQGLGDTIQALRWLPATRSLLPTTSITLYVEPPLARWTAQALTGLNIEVIASASTPLPSADAWCPLFSLPVALSHQDNQFDPLADAPLAALTWTQPKARPSRLRVGIVWAGNPQHDSAHHRDIPLADFLPLAEQSWLELHSLQAGPRAADIPTLGLPGLVHEHGPSLTNMYDTAAVIQSLDAVIACDTSVAHLAASMGAPTILMLNQRAVDWRWTMTGASTPWYPSMMVRRRPRADDSWKPTISALLPVLREMLSAA